MLLRRLSNRLCAQCWCSKSVIIRITFRLSLPLEAADSLSAWCSTCGSSRSPSDVVGGSCGLCIEVAGGGRASTRFQSLESTSRHAARTHVRLIRHDGLHKASCSWLIVAAPRRGGGARPGAERERRGRRAGKFWSLQITLRRRSRNARNEGLADRAGGAARAELHERGARQKVQGERPQRPDPSSRCEAHAPTGLRLSAGSCPQAMASLLAWWPRYLLACSRSPWPLCLLRPGRRA